MKEYLVFNHLESCPGPEAEEERKESLQQAGESSRANNVTQAQRTQNQAIERLPALNYSLLKEQQLRKKMFELGISNYGPRHLLEKRHKEWITLWNANCDALRPKKRTELLHDLEAWERTQGTRINVNRPTQGGPSVKDKDFDGFAWAVKHDSSFKDLIASARKSREHATKAKESEQTSAGADDAPEHVELDAITPTDPTISVAENDIFPNSDATPSVPLSRLEQDTISPMPEFQDAEGFVPSNPAPDVSLRAPHAVGLSRQQEFGDEDDLGPRPYGGGFTYRSDEKIEPHLVG